MKRAGRIVLRLAVMVAVVGVTLVAPQHLAWSAPETRMTKPLALSSGETADLPWPATHVVLQWKGDATATIRLRGVGAGDQAVWQDWQIARIDEDGGDEHESGMLIVDDVVKLQVEVVSGDVSDLRATAIDAENGPKHLEVVPATEKANAMGGATGQPDIIRRGDWGADEALRKGAPEFAPVQRMDVHHSVTSNNDDNPAATVRAIYQWHTGGNGWNDIGYNFLIDQQGRIYEGRYARSYGGGEKPTGEDVNGNGVIGAHTLNHNTGTVGIALLGTFNSVPPTSAQQDALIRLLAWEADRHNIDPMAVGAVLGHRDLYQTECPGDAAYSLLPTWRQKAAALRLLSYPPGNTPGYWVTAANGSVAPYGAAANYGSMAGVPLNGAVTSMSRTKSGRGYWLMGTDGGIFSFGDAAFYGSMGGKPLNQPVVGLAPTPTGGGYWLVAKDGGIFAFGDAQFYGSMGGKPLNKPIVGMAATPSGKGYWLVASDGGIFAFGDATFAGSTGSLKLNQPVMTMAAAPNGSGYWLFAKDGGVFAFNVPFLGSIPMLGLSSFGGAVQATATATGTGYYLLSASGGVYTFGDARFFGAPSGVQATSIALVPEH